MWKSFKKIPSSEENVKIVAVKLIALTNLLTDRWNKIFY